MREINYVIKKLGSGKEMRDKKRGKGVDNSEGRCPKKEGFRADHGVGLSENHEGSNPHSSYGTKQRGRRVEHKWGMAGNKFTKITGKKGRKHFKTIWEDSGKREES